MLDSSMNGGGCTGCAKILEYEKRQAVELLVNSDDGKCCSHIVGLEMNGTMSLLSQYYPSPLIHCRTRTQVE